MEFLIISGLSGAGKTQVIRIVEDLGYYCVDNMPPLLITKFAEMCLGLKGKINKVAFVIDIRGGEFFGELFQGLTLLEKLRYKYQILFLEANDDVLISRYKESRRKHPMASKNMLVSDAIAKERAILSEVREKADFIIDTSNLSVKDLRKRLIESLLEDTKKEGMSVNIVSFGYKYGILQDADLVFDVRFLPNPFYIPELKAHTGKDKNVSDFVLSYEQSKTFLNRLIDMIDYLLPFYQEEGKSQLVIGIGCTGGKHRSVTIAIELFKHLINGKFHTTINHRDIHK